MTRCCHICGICDRRVDHDHDPYYVETDPGHYDDEHDLYVVMRNGIAVRACFSCWRRWPNEYTRGWIGSDNDAPVPDGDAMVDIWSGSPVPVRGGWT